MARTDVWRVFTGDEECRMRRGSSMVEVSLQIVWREVVTMVRSGAAMVGEEIPPRS
jgi:hypothetical protein